MVEWPGGLLSFGLWDLELWDFQVEALGADDPGFEGSDLKLFMHMN